MKRTLQIFKNQTSWLVKDNDPKVKELFGTDTIPTAFTNNTSFLEVQTRLQELNPDVLIKEYRP